MPHLLLETPSPNFNDRHPKIHLPHRRGDGLPQMIVLHATQMEDFGEALKRLCCPVAKVSAHFAIAKNGEIHALVPVEKRAWHAGVSCWQGVRDVNSLSVGIELDNCFAPYPEAQLESLFELLETLCSTYDIHPSDVWGHADVAPQRKIDPGPTFPWKTLHQAGFGYAPPPQEAHRIAELMGHGDMLEENASSFCHTEHSQRRQEQLALLKTIGYDVDIDTLDSSLRSFREHIWV